MRGVFAILVTVGAVACPVQAQDTGAVPQPGDAYADAAARVLVREARARRVAVDTRIEAYETKVLERISMGLNAGLGERLLYRRETASHIHWTRDTVRIEVLGAREVLPAVKTTPQIPADLSAYVPALAFDPVDSEMLLRFDSTAVRNPLAAGSEADYRFASGDSTVIRLPDGRSVTLRELRITPRRRDPQLISGSFWLDADTYAVVQAYFRLARGYDSRRDSRGRAAGLMPAIHAEIDYIAVDYGFWELRWWLPRTVAARGMIQVGPLRMPLSYERRYDDYAVTGDTGRVAVDTTAAPAARLCRPSTRFTVQASVGQRDTASEATGRRARTRRDRRTPNPDPEVADSATICDREFIVTRASDEELMGSALLPGDAYAGESAVIDEAELRAIAGRVRGIPGPAWQVGRPVVQLGSSGPGLVRYNRVEGLSLGARALFDFGAAAADAELRIGTAAGEVGAEAGVSRSGGVEARVAGYRRLAAVDVAVTPFSVGSSAMALLLGRDDNDYFRATGAELTLRPPSVRRQWYDVRLFAEAQRPVAARTDLSLPHLLDSGRAFRDNIEADRTEQVGATVRLRATHGYDPTALRAAAELALHGEAGDYSFIRPAVHARAAVPLGPLGPRLVLGVEAAGGSSFGEPPAQRLWQLGGASTLRGYEGAVVRGEAFWRGRVELGVGSPLVRLAVIGDAGWAGARSEFGNGRPLRSVGAGLSVLDGLFRLDVARAVDSPTGWKLHFQLDGAL